MRTRMVEERVGEYLGPVDWNEEAWPFKLTDHQRETLRAIEAEPKAFSATTDGGWPKFGYHNVIQVGMWDGWPYWRPGPAVQVAGPIGPEWHWADDITAVSRLREVL
jgi:hypothetical protein